MKRVICAVLLALMPVLTAAAAERKIPAAKQKLILQLFEVTDANDNTTDAIIDILGGRLGVPPIPEEQRAEMREEGETMQQITEQTQMAIYDRYFSEKQLRDLIAFFKTDTGRHYVDVARKMATYEASGDGQHYRIVSSGIDGKIASASGSLQTEADANSYGDDIVFIDGKFVHGGDPVYKQ
jgi:hypothetical protein